MWLTPFDLTLACTALIAPDTPTTSSPPGAGVPIVFLADQRRGTNRPHTVALLTNRRIARPSFGLCVHTRRTRALPLFSPHRKLFNAADRGAICRDDLESISQSRDGLLVLPKKPTALWLTTHTVSHNYRTLGFRRYYSAGVHHFMQKFPLFT